MNNFQGDLTDISAEIEPLLQGSDEASTSISQAIQNHQQEQESALDSNLHSTASEEVQISDSTQEHKRMCTPCSFGTDNERPFSPAKDTAFSELALETQQLKELLRSTAAANKRNK